MKQNSPTLLFTGAIAGCRGRGWPWSSRGWWRIDRRGAWPQRATAVPLARPRKLFLRPSLTTTTDAAAARSCCLRWAATKERNPSPPRVVLLPLPVAWICTILIGNNSRRMRLQLFLVASRGGMILEMGQTRVQKSVYFSFGNGNDLVSGMWSSELVVNWGLLFGGRFSLLGCSSKDIVEIFGKYYYGKGKIGW